MKRALTDKELRKAREMHNQGIGYARIADYFACGKSTIRDNLKYWTAYSARVI